MFSTVFPEVVPFMRQCGKKYGGAGEATDDNIIWRMRFACWITKATHTHSICNAYCFCTAAMVTGRAPLSLYTCIASLLFF